MSNYTKTVNFATKDNLSPGNPLKIVKGTEIDTEYNNIATAVATKTDNSAAAITGGAIDGATVGSTTPAAGAFTTLAASSTTTLAGALVGAVTQAAFNTVSTTLNLGGAATAVNIGAATGTATVANTTLAAKAITASTTLNVTGASTLTGAVTATAGVTGPITSSSVSITGGSITGITDLAVADGGTGASTAAGALNNLLPAQASAANKYLQSDGTNASWDAVSLSTADITGTLGVANGGTGVTTSTGTTNVVLSNSPTLVTPILGTPTSATLTNATGLPISTGVSGLGTGVATLLATPSSANLASAITDETGSGSLVFATSPTLVTPILGTPTSGTLTNATGLPISTGVSGLGTGVATFLATPSSANLAAALTDETGTGSAVFATSPTLVTPLLGTPTSGVATNLTGLPLTTGVTGLLPVANGGTATATPSIVAGTNVTVTGTWPNQTIAASGGGTPGGSTTQVQYNNAGAFGGITGATTNGTALTLVAPVLGTPASGVVTNLTGTASININGTVGATTATTGAFTSVTASTTLGVTGVSTFSAGTAALPALTTSGDTNTGIFFPAADTVATSVAGVEGTRLTSTGLGIGTTSQAKLHVAGNIIANESQKIGFRYASGDPGPYVYMSAGAASASLNFYANASGTATDKNYIFYGTSLNTEIVNILGNGNISTIGLLDISAATAGQIKFPASQNASANANTLDDYEEGTWTPTDGSGASLSFTSVTGNYTKIGNKVTCWTRLTYPSTASTAGAQLSGLPFTVSTTLSASGGGMMAYKTTTALFSVRAINANAILMQNDTGGQPTNVALTLGTYIFAVTYFID